jgi:hypothetical protein
MVMAVRFMMVVVRVGQFSAALHQSLRSPVEQ